MAGIVREPKKDHSGYWNYFLGLTTKEVEVVKEPLEKALKVSQQRYDHYNDIYESGEATEAQQTKMVTYQNKVDVFKHILEEIDDYLRDEMDYAWRDDRIIEMEFLLKRTIEQGDAESEYRLGEIYYHGYGIEKDENKGIEWWKKAAKQGHAKAQKLLYRVC